MAKKFLSRSLIGIKKGLLTPTLSPEMVKFQKKPIIRIIRVIGGLSFICLLGQSHSNLELPSILLYLLFFFASMFFIYHIYITIYRYKHIKYLLKSEELDIRNSPLDKYGSMLARVLFCAKGVCDSATPVGLGLGLMLGADQVLKDGGREAFFGPLLGSGLNKVFPKSELAHWKDAYLEATNKLNNASKTNKIITELINKTPDLADISDDDKKDLFSLLTEIKNSNDMELNSAKEQALKILENKPK